MLVQPLRMATECEVDLVRRRPGCAIGLRPRIPDKPLETYHPETTHLTATCSCGGLRRRGLRPADERRPIRRMGGKMSGSHPFARRLPTRERGSIGDQSRLFRQSVNVFFEL